MIALLYHIPTQYIYKNKTIHSKSWNAPKLQDIDFWNWSNMSSHAKVMLNVHVIPKEMGQSVPCEKAMKGFNLHSNTID